MDNDNRPIPASVEIFCAGQLARDPEAVLSACSSGIEVTDDGRTHIGADAVRAWVVGEASEFTYTTTTLAGRECEPGEYELIQRLEGNFPGGVVHLAWRFTVSDGLVSALHIRPCAVAK